MSPGTNKDTACPICEEAVIWTPLGKERGTRATCCGAEWVMVVGEIPYLAAVKDSKRFGYRCIKYKKADMPLKLLPRRGD